MSRKTKQPIDRSSLLQSCEGSLAKIAAKTDYLTKLTNIVRQICPDIPADAYQISNFHQSAIVIEVKSAVWSQRLQFERVNIATALKELSQGQFDRIEIKISPFSAPKYEKKANTTHRYHAISSTAAKHIEALAASAPKSLQEKLQRLANLAKREQK